jgi:hypothetical protein
MAKPKPRPKPKPKKHDYLIDDKDVVYCFESNVSRCTVKARLWEGRRSDFHDAELQNATAEIHKILDRVERDNEDSSRHLCFIDFQSRLMLVWTRHDGVISSADTDAEIAKGLKIKAFNQR